MPPDSLVSDLLPKAGQQRAYWRAPTNASALAWTIAQCARAYPGPLLAVVRDNHAAHQLELDLRTLIGADPALPVLHFPDWETLPYDRFSPHPDIVSQRLAALHRLPGFNRGIVVVPVQTLMQRLAPVSYIAGGTFDVRVGQRMDLDAEKRRLEAAGYRNVPQVFDPGDFAVRGGLLDLYPMGADEPYRVELLDDEIDTIRAFDPESQRSLDKYESVQLLPGREVPLEGEALQRALDTLRDRFDIDTRRSALFQDLKAGAAPAGIEYYLPLFFNEKGRDRTATLFDYLDPQSLPLLGEGVSEAADHFWRGIGERYEQRRHDIERPLLPPNELYLPPDTLRERLNLGRRVEICGDGHPRREDAVPTGTQPAPDMPVAARDDAPASTFKRLLDTYPGRVVVATDSAGRREAMLEVLQAADLHPQVVADLQTMRARIGRDGDAAPRFAITVAPLDNGFAIDRFDVVDGRDEPLLLLTERQLFPERAAQPRGTRTRSDHPRFGRTVRRRAGGA
jgi:transcription-repair coupling factor (superfamily II helicase)